VILDTSAVVALIRDEQGADALLEKVRGANSVGIGGPTLFEASIVLIRRHGLPGHTALTSFLQERDVITVAFDHRHWRVAEEAFLRFGKGRQAAGLNFGDCMSYATARVAGESLLFVGNDFARTDIAPA
jgi:ribonuclease VapC